MVSGSQFSVLLREFLRLPQVSGFDLRVFQPITVNHQP